MCRASLPAPSSNSVVPHAPLRRPAARRGASPPEVSRKMRTISTPEKSAASAWRGSECATSRPRLSTTYTSKTPPATRRSRDRADRLQAGDREHDARDLAGGEHGLAEHDHRLLQRRGHDRHRDHRRAVLASLEGLLQLVLQPLVLQREARLRAEARRVDYADVHQAVGPLEVALERLLLADPRDPRGERRGAGRAVR